MFERFETPQPLGSGIILQPTGLRVLHELGLGDAISSAGNRIDHLVGHTSSPLRRVLNVNYAALGGDLFGVAIHRGALFEILYGKVSASDATIYAGCEIDDPRNLDDYDLIVDASGAASLLRKQASRSTRIRRLDYGAIWGSFDWTGAPFKNNCLEQRYVAAHTMIGVLPIGTGVSGTSKKVAFFWSLPDGDYESWRATGLDSWKSDVREIWPETSAILDQITSSDQMTMARYCHHTMQLPYSDNIVFVGDAAHATSPQLGQGANMALLDAWALGHALGRSKNLQDALSAYASSRRWHVRGFQFASLMLTPFYQSNSRLLSQIRDLSFDAISRMPGCRRIVAGLISGTLGNPLRKIGLRN